MPTASAKAISQPSRARLWLIPLSILIHNVEEYPRIVAFAQRHGIRIRARPMGIAVALATLLPFPLVRAAIRYPHNRRYQQAALALPALMAVNAGTHLAQTLLLRDYSPGTITGLGIQVPLAVWLYRTTVREQALTAHELRQAALLGAGMMGPAAALLQLVGWGIDRLLPRQAAARPARA